MSILICDSCERHIDTDDEPEAYREAVQRWICGVCWKEMVGETYDEWRTDERYLNASKGE